MRKREGRRKEGEEREGEGEERRKDRDGVERENRRWRKSWGSQAVPLICQVGSHLAAGDDVSSC